MPDSFTVGETSAHVHVPASVTFDASRNGYIIRCGSFLLPIALIPMEWPIAQTMTMWQDDAQRWDYIREADAIQRRGEQCVCGRAPVGVQQVNGSRCGQCNPQTIILTPPAIIDSAYRSADTTKPFSRAAHEIEDVRGRLVSDVAFLCKCGWGVTRKFAKAVYEANGERELIKMLEAHCAGGQVGPRAKGPNWTVPELYERMARTFWKSPSLKILWITPAMSEPAYTPRRRIILED